MTARILSVDTAGAMEEAVRLLAAGELVVFPTDTVYGVGAHGLRDEAIRKLFEAKFRPAHKAIPLLLSDALDVEQVGERLSPLAYKLMARYWPGALTLVVWARPGLPAATCRPRWASGLKCASSTANCRPISPNRPNA